MPISYSIDRQRRLITVAIVGEFDEKAMRQIEREVTSDPAYDRNYDSLIDAREARNLIGSLSVLRQMAAERSVNPGVRRAFVTDNLLIYGLARLFQSTHDAEGLADEVRVFRKIDEANSWLTTPRANGSTRS